MRYAVLGGGAAGLTAALRLVEAGEEVALFEREPLPGGLASGFRVGDAWLERFYHHLFGTDTAIIRLIDEIGLSDRLLWGYPRTQMLLDGREHRLDSATSLLQFSPLPLHDRLRMGAVLAFLKVMRDPSRLEGQTASAWLRSRMGRRAYERVWRPQQRAKFGDLADEIAAPWFWARVHDRTSSLGYLRGGFQQLYDRLVECVEARGGTIHLGVEVTAIRRDQPSGLVVETSLGAERYDRVISTLPTRITCRLAPDLPASYRERYDWGQAYGAHCLVLALDRQLTESYWLSILDDGYPFMALVEHTNWLPASDYGGRRLVYLGNYRPMSDPLFAAPADALLDEYAPHLRRINPAFERSWVQELWSFAAPFAQPIVTVDFKEHIPSAATPVPGLFIANMFQVYPHDRGQNYSIEIASQLAHDLLDDRVGRSAPR